MFVTSSCTEFMEKQGLMEPSRQEVLRLLRIHAGDDLFRWCSQVVASKVFERSGVVEAMKKKKRKRGEEEDDEEDWQDPVSRSWHVEAPKVTMAAEAAGFGIATSVRAWQQAAVDIWQRENAAGMPMASPCPALPSGVEQDTQLLYVEPNVCRVFYGSGPSPRWKLALPVVARVDDPGRETVESIKLEFSRSDVVDDGSLKRWHWYVFNDDDVYVYVAEPSDLPDVATGLPRSKVQRLLPERIREQINNVAMSEVNLLNTRPPIPYEKKETGSGKKSGGNEGGDNELERNDPPTGAAAIDVDTAERHIKAAVLPPQHPSPYGRFVDVGLRQKQGLKEEKRQDEDWAMEGIGCGSSREADTLSRLVLQDRTVTVPKGWAIGQTQLPLPPQYYTEQKAHRKFAAAAAFGIPWGIVLNYSLMEAASESSVSVPGNKSSGLGGSTSSVKSTAWNLWETTTKGIQRALERWSVDVLRRMMRLQLEVHNAAKLNAHLRGRRGGVCAAPRHWRRAVCPAPVGGVGAEGRAVARGQRTESARSASLVRRRRRADGHVPAASSPSRRADQVAARREHNHFRRGYSRDSHRDGVAAVSFRGGTRSGRGARGTKQTATADSGRRGQVQVTCDQAEACA